MKTKTCRVAALLMCLVLMIGAEIVPAGLTQAKTVTKQDSTNTSPLEQELLKMLKENVFQKTTVKDYGHIYIKKNGSADAADYLLLEAQKIKSEKGSAKYVSFDIDRNGADEWFVTYSSGKKMGCTVMSFDSGSMKTVRLGSYDAFDEIRYDSVNPNFLLIQKKNKYSVTYTVYQKSGSSIKKEVTYSSSGKKAKKITYKKNNKKISKKTFNKQIKKLLAWDKKSASEISDTKPEMNPVVGEAWLAENDYVYTRTTKNARDTIVYKMGDKALGEVNRYQSFRINYARNNGVVSATPAYVERKLFGPYILNPVSNITYQEMDWKASVINLFDGGEVCPYLTLKKDPTTNQEVFSWNNDLIGDVMVLPTYEANGSGQKYQVSTYVFKSGSKKFEISFYMEGKLMGRIRKMKVSQDGSDLVLNEWNWLYGDAAAPKGAVYDATALKYVNAEIVEPATGRREIKVNYDTEDPNLRQYMQSLSVANNVLFTLESTYGHFFTLDAANAKTIINAENVSGYEQSLNPGPGPLYDKAIFEKGLFWEPVK